MKANPDSIKATKCFQRSIMQDSELWLKLIAKYTNKRNDLMSSMATQLMTNVRE